MDEEPNEKNLLITTWHTEFKRGTDFDLWGQPVEAIDCYTKLSTHFKTEGNQESKLFTDDQKKILNKLAVCLELRSRALQTPGKIEGVTLEDLRKAEKCLTNNLSINSKDFPIDINRAHILSSKLALSSVTREASSQKGQFSADLTDENEEMFDQRATGSLLPAPVPVRGETLLSVRIEKIGLKEPAQYLDSYMTVSVKDQHGFDLLPPQDTPVATQKEDNYIYFGVSVHIQKTIESLPSGGRNIEVVYKAGFTVHVNQATTCRRADFAVFFEFKHYKPKKKLVSTKCWAFMEKEEIKEGSAVVEIYQKPADYKRKKIKLLTVKPLYLHLKVILN